MGYALLREKAPLGQKVEDLGLRLENVLLSHCCVRGKSAANDKCASGAVLPGQYFDQETGLHYNYFRDYNPNLGRYVQSDSIGVFAGPNTYSYVLQNPLRYSDATGQIIPIFVACALNPICSGSVRAAAGALIGGLTATVSALSDPCFDGSIGRVARDGAAIGAISSFIPGGGALVAAAIRGGAAGAGGNIVGQVAANGSGNIDASQVLVSGAIGSLAFAFGNIIGLQTALNAVRSGRSANLALAIGVSAAATEATLITTFGNVAQAADQNLNAQCNCNR